MGWNDSRDSNAEFEYGSAEQARYVEPSPANGARRFVASPPFFGSNFGSKWNPMPSFMSTLFYIGGALALVFVLAFAVSMMRGSTAWLYEVVGSAARPMLGLLVLLVIGGITLSYIRTSNEEIYLDATGDGLTISVRPGEFFPFDGAHLGQWAFSQATGSALHLHCGPKRFVLGGRDHRLSGTTHFDAPPVGNVDAWLWAADFEALLVIAGRSVGGSPPVMPVSGQVREPQPVGGQATRCSLFPNPEVVSVQPLWAPWRTTRVAKSFMVPQQSTLAIDVGGDIVSVVDTEANVVRASAQLNQVMAAPEVFILLRPYIFKWPLRFFPWGYLKNFQWTTPVLAVQVPGSEPLSISCRDVPGNDYLFMLTGTFANRFAWHFKVPMRINRPADYSISSADWLTLVDAFGLTQSLEDRVKRD